MFLAFLRAVNVGGGKVAMADLRQMMDDLGLRNGKTLLNTGNMVFESDGKSASETESFLKKEAEARLGLKTEFMVRTIAEMEAIIAGNPFTKEAIEDPSHLLVLFGSGPTTGDCEEKLKAAIQGREYFQCEGNNFYFVYPDNIGDSKLTIKIIEKYLSVNVTGRNWNTVQKMLALAKSLN